MLFSIQMATKAKVLILEDDTLVISSLKILLKEHDLSFYTCAPEFLEKHSGPTNFDLLLLDLCHPGDPEGTETVELFPELQRRLPHAEIVIQSGLKDIAIMRKCLQLGAEKFVLKDHIADEIPVFIEHCLDRRLLRQELDKSIIGESRPISELKKRLLELRKQNQVVDVLIEGETGCGKELCAKALHRDGPFVGINVAAIPADLFEAEFFGAEKGAYTGASASREGYLESAGNGILFMDEIQSLPLNLQAKLLRVLETRCFFRVGSSVERKFKGRIVSASNLPLLECVKHGAFREDLYYRLSATRVNVPPLRVRGSDISLLAKYFLSTAENKNLQFTDEALKFLEQSYDWPGNVRELRVLVRRVAMESKMPFLDKPEIETYIEKSDSAVDLALKDFKAQVNGGTDGHYQPDFNLSFDESVLAFEKFLFSQTLKTLTTSQAREKLRLSRTRFYEKLKQYGLQNKHLQDTE
ncbi:MAG: sigma-54 dependent transcriptional regulator [Bdellovibrionota bacterium]